MIDVAIAARPTAESPSCLGEQELSRLVVLAQGGCATSFTELAAHFRPRLLRFLEGRLKTAADAEDVVQDSLTKAWQNLARYQATFAFSTWLFTIAHRAAIDFLRSQRRFRAVSIDISSDKSQNEGASVTQLPDPSANTAERFEASDEAQNIWAFARENLNETQYSVLWLRFGEDMSMKEIAKVLRKTNISVRVALHRAKSLLQNGLEKQQRQLNTIANEVVPATRPKGQV